MSESMVKTVYVHTNAFKSDSHFLKNKTHTLITQAKQNNAQATGFQSGKT